MLLSIGVIDCATRMGFLTFLPFLLTAKGASLPTVGLALTLVFVGGAAGKLVCAWIGARIGVVATVWLTEGFTALGILALLPLPLEFGLMLLPLIGVALNGTSSVLYGSVPLMVAPEKRTRAFSIFYTGTIGSGAVAPILYGLIGDALGVPLALMVVAALVLATLAAGADDPAAGRRIVTGSSTGGPGIRTLCAEILNAPVIHSRRHRMGMTQMSQLSLNEERRRMPRQRTLKSARIVIDPQGPVLDCIVRNLSAARRAAAGAVARGAGPVRACCFPRVARATPARSRGARIDRVGVVFE